MSAVNEVPARRDETVRSVDRALSILQVVAQHGALGVSEIAQAVGVHKSTVFRLLLTLESRGMVVQSHDRGEYRLGYAVAQLAGGLTARQDLTLVSRNTTQLLADTVGETVNVAIHDGTAVISIDQHTGPSAITAVDWVGRRGPLHATAAGKVFLAFPDSEGRPEIPAELVAYTSHTVSDAEALQRQLGEVRDRGWSVSRGEQEEGLVAVGAPIRDFDGAVVAAVVVSGPNFRMTDEAVPAVAERTVAAAEEISHRNGLPKRG
jgi:DNA-binding IclR family transcriptional regulator